MARLLKVLIKKMIWPVVFMISITALMIMPFFSSWILYGINLIPLNVQTSEAQQPVKVIVVLGGGLRKKKSQEIVINKYTKNRLKTTVKMHKEHHLPILFSGVEGPWVKKWFLANKIDAEKLILEGKSLNTCENVNFTSIKLKELGINHIYLITDAYHQQRARLNFAKKGIFTTPVTASLANEQKNWETPKLNFHNSRRAIYEVLAILRDRLQPQSTKECKEKPKNNAKPDFKEFNLKRLLNSKSVDQPSQ